MPVVTFEHLVIDFISYLMFPSELSADRCSLSMLASNIESVLMEPLIWSLPSSSSCAFLAYSLVRYELTFCISPCSNL